MSNFSTVLSSFCDQVQKVLDLPQKMLSLPPCTEHIINYFAFTPPHPTYRLYYNTLTRKYEFDFAGRPSELPPYFNVSRINREMDFTFTKTKYYTDIACMYYFVNRKSKLTILYSHGNSCDLGDLIFLVVYLAKELDCNMFVYDYSGYGCSTGKSTENQVYADIEAAALHLVHHYGLSFTDIVLYGQSIGSAPTLDLASRLDVRGVVVQSGFTSAIAVPFPKMQATAKRWDQFRNIDKIGKVSAPTLIIHGTDDRIVNFSHGVDLYNKCPAAVEPLWIEGAGHLDIESHDVFIERLKRFVNKQLRSYHFPNGQTDSYSRHSHHSGSHRSQRRSQ